MDSSPYILPKPPFKISPPIERAFRRAEKLEAKVFYQWYIASIGVRSGTLQSLVNSGQRPRAWRADFSPESLQVLETWFMKHAESRSLTDSEQHARVIDAPAHLTRFLQAPALVATDMTLAWVLDIALYFSGVLKRNIPELEWAQEKSRASIFFQMPILKLTSCLDRCAPIHTAGALCYRAINKEHAKAFLLGEFERWRKLAKEDV